MAEIRSFLQINLLPKDSFEFSTLGKFLSWAMTSGRVMVVLTEFVVLLAFGSRFYFDKKLNDLSENVDQKLAQIETYSEVETEMRAILNRQKPILEYLEKNINFSKRYSELSTILPKTVHVEKIYLDKDTLRITGKSESEFAFAKLLKNMKLMSDISYMNIKDTSFDQTTKSVSFTIQANFN